MDELGKDVQVILSSMRSFVETASAVGSRAGAHKRKPTWDEAKNPEGCWRRFTYEELVARDKTSLDIFWLKDKSLTDLDNLPEPDDLAEEIIENLEASLNSFREVLAGLRQSSPGDERHPRRRAR